MAKKDPITETVKKLQAPKLAEASPEKPDLFKVYKDVREKLFQATSAAKDASALLGGTSHGDGDPTAAVAEIDEFLRKAKAAHAEFYKVYNANLPKDAHKIQNVAI